MSPTGMRFQNSTEIGVGSQLSGSAKLRGLTARLLVRLSESVAGRSIVMRGRAPGINLTRCHALRPVGNTRKVITGSGVFEGSGLSAVWGWSKSRI